MWRKSSRSAESGNCVEVRNDLTALRDTKRPEAALPVARPAVAKLITFVRSSPR